MDSPTGYNGKLDDATAENTNSRKQSPHTSPSHINADLTNGTSNEVLPSVTTLGPGDDPNDNGIPSSHLMMNGLPTASVPIPYQRVQASAAQQQEQQPQPHMLLYQQQAYVVDCPHVLSSMILISNVQISSPVPNYAKTTTATTTIRSLRYESSIDKFSNI